MSADFETGDGPFITQDSVPQLTDLDVDEVAVERDERWEMRDLERNLPGLSGGRHFVHASDDTLTVTMVGPAHTWAIQTRLAADVEQPFWTSFASQDAYEQFVGDIEDALPVFEFDGADNCLRYAEPHERSVPLIHSGRDCPVVEAPVTDRTDYPTVVVPGWRLAGAFTMAARQAKANRVFQVALRSDGERICAVADGEDIEDPVATTIATGGFDTFRVPFTTDYLLGLARTVRDGDHLMRVAEERPLLLDDGTTRYAVAPRIMADDVDQDGDEDGDSE